MLKLLAALSSTLKRST